MTSFNFDSYWNYQNILIWTLFRRMEAFQIYLPLLIVGRVPKNKSKFVGMSVCLLNFSQQEAPSKYVNSAKP